MSSQAENLSGKNKKKVSPEVLNDRNKKNWTQSPRQQTDK